MIGNSTRNELGTVSWLKVSPMNSDDAASVAKQRTIIGGKCLNHRKSCGCGIHISIGKGVLGKDAGRPCEYRIIITGSAKQ
jgi:hypothetical protein